MFCGFESHYPRFIININKDVLITKEIEIDMGHRVPNHKSKCKNPHGHRYKIEVGVDDKLVELEGDSSEGMVIDFGDLKQIMMDVLDVGFDHGFVIYTKDAYLDFYETMEEDGLKIIKVPFIPTAENLAKYWFQLIQLPLSLKGISLRHVKIWETPTSTATWTLLEEAN